jgi:hypothetical protein
MITRIYIYVRTTVIMAGLSLQKPRFNPRRNIVWLVVEKVVLDQLLLHNISGFPCQLSFHQCYILIHPSITDAVWSCCSATHIPTQEWAHCHSSQPIPQYSAPIPTFCSSELEDTLSPRKVRLLPRNILENANVYRLIIELKPLALITKLWE